MDALGQAGPLVRMADGTVKQVNPFTGTQVWTVPGRGKRPLASGIPDPEPIDLAMTGRHCAFCEDRYLETTPEKARLVRGPGGFDLQEGLTADDVVAAPADFRLIPNLFEILSFDYWHLNHGYVADPTAQARASHYLATPLGRDHVLGLVRTRLQAKGYTEEEAHRLALEDTLAETDAFFAGCHDVVVSRRHFVDGATTTDQAAGSGSLTPEEHEAFLRLAVESARRLLAENRAAEYAVIFQNWLRPAGASFDHLHKQVVAVDDVGRRAREEADQVRRDPEFYRRWGVGFAEEHGLVVARNRHASLIAGVGHRFPSLEVWAHEPALPWEMSGEAFRAWSDLVHAAHAATGPLVPTNEEWHYRAPRSDIEAPLRCVLKWRITTPAGFEGGTEIYVNTIDPWTLAARARAELRRLASGGIADVELVG